jgi:CheY-like chemotaxis protein
MMGGTMGVESAPGVGSTFLVEVAVTQEAREVEEIAPADAAPAQARFPSEHTILYIEDNLSNLRLVERVLARRPDLKLIAAMQAGLGLELAAEHLPSLILLDLNLPDMTGHEALVHLQGNPRTCAIPIVVLSADATPGQFARLLAAGAAAYLTKPLEVTRFLNLVDETLSASLGAPPLRRLGSEGSAAACA